LPTPSAPASLPLAAAPIAPGWHTAALVSLYVAVALTGALLSHHGVSPAPSPASGRIVSVYLPLLVVQWSVLFYVVRVGRPRSALVALLGRRWTSAGRAAGDLALALSFWVLVVAFEVAWARIAPPQSLVSVRGMLPQGGLERLAWGFVAVSVGFCEEVVFRGYLQTQLAAFTGRPHLALVLQATLFGVAHGEQGAAAAVRIGLYGLALGALARFRKSLVPGIIAHGLTDVASGLLRRL
jgi:membrane protease YdiL (CAAX protease family)